MAGDPDGGPGRGSCRAGQPASRQPPRSRRRTSIANPQAYNGVSPVVPPIPINYDILHVQERGSIVYCNFAHNHFVNIWLHRHRHDGAEQPFLFAGHTILQWAWAEEP